ncbi:MAG: DUF4438 domain-containing protein [Myxococcota bacterium]
MRTNEDRLPHMAVPGKPRHPTGSSWQVSHEGEPFFSHRTGGILYNVKVGDSVYGWPADHLEPCVSMIAGQGGRKDPNFALQGFACVGNRVRIMSGDAKGEEGVVTGKHGGIETVMVDFADEVLERMSYEDKLLVRSVGPGLELLDYPTVKPWNLDPGLLVKMGIEEVGGKLHVPVVAIVPGGLMGSGIGSSMPFAGDYDIQTADNDLLAEHGLATLRLGDFVAITDHHATHGWTTKKGGVIIGIIIHGDSFKGGHGPGVTSLLTATDGTLVPKLVPQANIAETLGIGRAR